MSYDSHNFQPVAARIERMDGLDHVLSVSRPQSDKPLDFELYYNGSPVFSIENKTARYVLCMVIAEPDSIHSVEALPPRNRRRASCRLALRGANDALSQKAGFRFRPFKAQEDHQGRLEGFFLQASADAAVALEGAKPIHQKNAIVVPVDLPPEEQKRHNNAIYHHIMTMMDSGQEAAYGDVHTWALLNGYSVEQLPEVIGLAVRVSRNKSNN